MQTAGQRSWWKPCKAKLPAWFIVFKTRFRPAVLTSAIIQAEIRINHSETARTGLAIAENQQIEALYNEKWLHVQLCLYYGGCIKIIILSIFL
ncbi:MAG: hypothetical protein CEE38_03895 [Planctomycetes bacterium B3_Pla]|nr:MAG: hypothetical protein CEE38_03895 [Planctomycetes bacterium B3_Pla]